MIINVIGLGYIGLPTALMLAAHGVEVIGTDYNAELVATLNAGKTTFKENGLDELFSKAVKAGIRFTTEYQVTDTYIVSVPTPYDKFSKKVDACYVVAAVKNVMDVCPKGATVVIESTVSPGTIDKYVRPAVEANGFKIGEDIHLVHAPERIIPGNMIYELLHNNRTIGADEKAVGERIKELYASFCQGEIVVTDIRTAEMTKVVENTFRAVNIAFANELAKICRHDNMDVYEIIRICNMHPRVNILQPGPGVGGHCISVDPWFLVGDYPSIAKVIDESMKTNDGNSPYGLYYTPTAFLPVPGALSTDRGSADSDVPAHQLGIHAVYTHSGRIPCRACSVSCLYPNSWLGYSLLCGTGTAAWRRMGRFCCALPGAADRRGAEYRSVSALRVSAECRV